MTTKLLLTLAAKYGWKFRTADIKNAFLNGEHHGRTIYMQYPPGFGKPGHVCKLNKSLYGLRTAAITWYLDLRDKLEKMGFKASQHDECLFIRQSTRTYITVHVDDLGIYNDQNDEVISQLSQYFKLNATNQERYLGMEITRADGIRVSQAAYTQSILDEFDSLVRPSNTPISMRATYNHTSKATPTEVTQFQRVIGKLIYLACNTRPDIMYAVIHASSFAQNPSPSAWEVVRDTLGYLSRTTQYGITLKGGTPDELIQLTQYSDASFATGKDSRSISGRITTLNGSPISWQSHQQTSVATSTAHSEYIAAYEATVHVLPIQQLLCEIMADTSIKTPQLCLDNTATLSTADSGILTRQNRHFLVKYYWLHEQVKGGQITPRWVHTDEQMADILTKPLPQEKLQKFIQLAQLGS